MRKFKKIIALFISVTVLLGALPVEAADMQDLFGENEEQEQQIQQELPTGRMQDPIRRATDVSDSDIYTPKHTTGRLYRSAIYNSSWDIYSSNYYYNQLSAQDRKLWDDLDQLCMTYLTTTKNASSDNGYYRTAMLPIEGSDVTHAQSIASIFRVYNPQYYFLEPGAWWGQNNYGKYTIGMSIYKNFADGNVRMQDTNNFKAVLDSWENQVNQGANDADKVKIAHDIICANVDYNNAFVSDYDEERWMTQTAYNVMCSDLTVCAGYAMAFSMLCNGAGVDCISVTSEDHQWNKVRINDSWYNLDCTWDDSTGNPYSYYYFEKSDSTFSESSHQTVALWSGYLPVCSQDSSAYGSSAGTLQQVSGQTQQPVVSVEEQVGVYMATITSATSNANIYYTVNGGTPSSASTKSTKYTQSFEVETGDVIRAVATRDTLYDSDVIVYEVTVPTMYSITYNLAGGTISGNKTSYTVQDADYTLPTPTKFGYTFTGWTGSNGSMPQVTVTIPRGSMGNKSYTANWEIIPQPIVVEDHSNVEYKTHIQDIGWEADWKSNGQMSGTSGQSKRLEAIEIRLTNQTYSGGIQYKTHIQNIGWESDWKSNGQMSGTSGKSYRLEAIQIQLTGEIANYYDVYYRVHAQNFGWLDWARNGQSAGTAGYSYRLEAIQIQLVKKGQAAPGSTASPF